MSKSFSIIGGDLNVGNARTLGLVSGQDKLLQDLKCWIMERVGNDPATPTFGSRFDGGQAGGVIAVSMIGQALTEEAVLETKHQLAELINRYRIYQLDKIQREIAKYGETTIKGDETISRIKKIDAIILGDTIALKAVIVTLANQDLKVVIPILLQA